ncbi:MAG: tetratricopeptide repeat protein [Saprospiraceae bacterium]
MTTQSSEIKEIFEYAKHYDRLGDHYNAIKLFKKLVRLSPEWSVPYQYLGSIYKTRKEWKPSFHYIQKAIEADPQDKESWCNLGIVATAMKRWQIARVAWNETGYDFNPKKETAIDAPMGSVPVRLNPNRQSEIIWATRIDPARAYIESIPHPQSGKRYRDLILIDGAEQGYRIVDNRRLPVYDELSVLQSSRYRTYAVELAEVTPNDIDVLDRLCLAADLGFDNWTKATRSVVAQQSGRLPEYYNDLLDEEWNGDAYVIGIAAKSEAELLALLKNWEVITLKNFYDYECVL